MLAARHQTNAGGGSLPIMLPMSGRQVYTAFSNACMQVVFCAQTVKSVSYKI